jgi:Icc protein
MQPSKNYFKVIQITDSHLFKGNADLFGVDSNKNFNFIMNKVIDTDLDDLDAIFLTGDLSQDQSPESYEIIADKISILNVPAYWIAGNHDSIELMRSIFERHTFLKSTRKLSIRNWDFIFLNTCLIDHDDGHISTSELQELETAIANANNSNRALIMHHHPVEVGTPLVDKYILQNSEAFLNLVSKYQIDLILCGHVHGDYSLKYLNTDIHTSPATCLQWEKGTRELVIDHRIGYKIYYFRDTCYDVKTRIWNA